MLFSRNEIDPIWERNDVIKWKMNEYHDFAWCNGIFSHFQFQFSFYSSLSAWKSFSISLIRVWRRDSLKISSKYIRKWSIISMEFGWMNPFEANRRELMHSKKKTSIEPPSNMYIVGSFYQCYLMLMDVFGVCVLFLFFFLSLSLSSFSFIWLQANWQRIFRFTFAYSARLAVIPFMSLISTLFSIVWLFVDAWCVFIGVQQSQETFVLSNSNSSHWQKQKKRREKPKRKW